MSSAPYAATVSNGQAFEIIPFDGAVGAEIIGLDLTRPLSDADFARVHRAHMDHHVVVFRDQRITPEQQIAFSRRFGELHIHVLKQFLLTGHPEILIVSNIVEQGAPIGLGDAGKFWHSDLSYKPLPSLGSMLHAQELPSEGGDTLFADMHKALDALPAELRKVIDGKQAAHSYTARYSEPKFEGDWRPRLSAEQLAQVQEVIHPIVRTHPESGCKALFVSEGSRPGSSVCPRTRAGRCWRSFTATACCLKTSIAMPGSLTTLCSGITARLFTWRPAAQPTCGANCTALLSRATRPSRRPLGNPVIRPRHGAARHSLARPVMHRRGGCYQVA